jgi:hypothetical protein
MLLLILFGVHFLYDFHWQGDFISRYKGKDLFILLIHSFTWAFLLMMVFLFAKMFSWQILIFLTLTHVFMDGIKAKALEKPNISEIQMRGWLYLDQIVHAASILISYFWLTHWYGG